MAPRQQSFKSPTGHLEREATPLHLTNGMGEARSQWLRTRDAAVYCGRSVKGFRAWAHRHGLTSIDGAWARRDIDKARAVPRKRQVMAEASLKNLVHGRQRTRSAVSASASASEAGGESC